MLAGETKFVLVQQVNVQTVHRISIKFLIDIVALKSRMMWTEFVALGGCENEDVNLVQAVVDRV